MEPVTDDEPGVAVSPEFYSDMIVILTGALICKAGDQGYARGDCHSGSFHAALPTTDRGTHTQLFASIYTSEIGRGSETSTASIHSVGISPAIRPSKPIITPTILIENSLYWSYICLLEALA